MRPKLRLSDEEKRVELSLAWDEQGGEVERERLQAMKLAYTGQHTLVEIADLVGRGRRSVARWVKAFRLGGVAALKAKPRGGRREKRTLVDEPTGAALLEGLRQGKWNRAHDIQEWLKKERKTKLSLPGLYNWLRRHRAKPRVPRKSHGKKDPAKAA